MARRSNPTSLHRRRSWFSLACACMCGLTSAVDPVATASLLSVKKIGGIDSGIQATATDTEFVYVADSQTIAQISPKGMAVQSKLKLAGYEQNAALGLDAAYVYVATRTAGSNGNGAIAKLTKNPLRLNMAIQLPEQDGVVYSLLVDNQHIYAGTYAFPAQIIKFEKTTLKRVKDVRLEQGQDDVRTLVADATDPTDEYIYAMTNTSPGQVIKIQKSDLTVVKSTQLKTGENNLLAGTTVDSQHIYVASSSTPATIVKLDKMTLVRMGSYTLEGAGFISSIVADAFSIFAVTYTSPSLLVQVVKKDMKKKIALMLESSDAMLSKSSAVAAHGQNLFVGTDTKPPYLCMLSGYEAGRQPFDATTTLTANTIESVPEHILTTAQDLAPAPASPSAVPSPSPTLGGCLYNAWSPFTPCKSKDGVSCAGQKIRVQEPAQSNAPGCKMRVQNQACVVPIPECAPTRAPTLAPPQAVATVPTWAAPLAEHDRVVGILPPVIADSSLQAAANRLRQQLNLIKQEEVLLHQKRAAQAALKARAFKPTSSQLASLPPNAIKKQAKKLQHATTPSAVPLLTGSAPTATAAPAAPAASAAPAAAALAGKAALAQELRAQARKTALLRQAMQRKKLQQGLGSVCSSIYCFLDKKGRMVTSAKKAAETKGNRHKCRVNKLSGACECRCWDERRLVNQPNPAPTVKHRTAEKFLGKLHVVMAPALVDDDLVG